MALENFVGKGVIFPVELDTTGAPITRTGITLINSSISMILGWDNDKVFLPEFRSRIVDLIEEPNDEVLRSLVQFFIYEALTTWERRINVLDIVAEVKNSEQLDVRIEYQITNTQIQETFVYPFYREIIY